jgi:ATP synthase protein I
VADDDPDKRAQEPGERMRAEVARKAQRRGSASREQNRSIWFSLGLLGVVGWSVTIPALLGIALGAWIDGRWPSRVSWTLTLLLLGIVVGGINAWRWIEQQGRGD